MSCVVCDAKCDEAFYDRPGAPAIGDITQLGGGYCDECGKFICSDCLVFYSKEDAEIIAKQIFVALPDKQKNDEVLLQKLSLFLANDFDLFGYYYNKFDDIEDFYNRIGLEIDQVPSALCPLCQNTEFSREELLKELFALAKIKDEDELKQIILEKNGGSIAAYHKRINTLKKLDD